MPREKEVETGHQRRKEFNENGEEGGTSWSKLEIHVLPRSLHMEDEVGELSSKALPHT